MKEKSKSEVSIIGGADAHTLDELVQYAMNTYNLIETNSTERKYIEQQKSLMMN